MALPMMRAVQSVQILMSHRLWPYHECPVAVSNVQRQEEETYMSTLICVCPEKISISYPNFEKRPTPGDSGHDDQ